LIFNSNRAEGRKHWHCKVGSTVISGSRATEARDMESKKLKLKVHHRNFSAEDLIVNPEALSKEKFEIREGDLLEIFPPDDHHNTWRSHLILRVKTLPPDIQSKGGPFSILQEVALAFTLTGLREVLVRRV
ncbi:hypothetical protein GBAR_LOCUS3119, partial [Geodia barretti]